MRNLILLLSLVGFAMMIACKEESPEPEVDPAIQRAIDIDLIDEYLDIKGLSNVDTTESGVRYVILNEGDGDEIDESDIVTFNYTGILLNDTIFDSTLKLVLDSVRMAAELDKIGKEDTIVNEIILSFFPELEKDTPLDITYSSSGWSFQELVSPRSPRSLVVENRVRVIGFEQGIAASFNSLKEGGIVRLLIPSNLGYGALDGFMIPTNSVLIFDVFIDQVEKQ